MNFTREQVSDFLKNQFKHGDLIVKLIFVNIGLYLGFKSIQLLEWILRFETKPVSTFIENWVALPNHLNEIWIKSYTIFSYSFFHFDLLHLFFNMMLVYFFGKMLLRQVGIKKIVPLYIIGGLFGGIVFVAFTFLPYFKEMDPIVGASAAAMALMGACTMLNPDHVLKFFLFFDVKLKWLSIVFGLLNLLTIFNPENPGSGVIHIAGLLFGCTFILLDQNGIEISKPFNKLADFIVSWFKKNPKVKVTYVNPEKATVAHTSDNQIDQKKVDAILDKISQNGYESLTKLEKEYLFRASKK